MADGDDKEMTADLTALAAAAHGEPAGPRRAPEPVRDEARERRIAELRAQYLAGGLSVDEQALAAKLVDSLFDPPADTTG